MALAQRKGFNTLAKKALQHNRQSEQDDLRKSLIDNEGNSNINQSADGNDEPVHRPPSYHEIYSDNNPPPKESPSPENAPSPESPSSNSISSKESPWKRFKQIHNESQESNVAPPPAETKPAPIKESPWKRLKQQQQVGDTKKTELNVNDAPNNNATHPEPKPPSTSGWGKLKQRQAENKTLPNANVQQLPPTKNHVDSPKLPQDTNGELHSPGPKEKNDLASAAFSLHATRKVTDALKEKASARIKLKQKLALKDRMRQLVQERLTVRQIFRRYVDSSTLHGFCYVASDTFMIRRIIWALLMIIGAVYFLIKLKDGIIRFQSYPFTTKANTLYVNDLDFPAISICPINNLNAERFQGTILDRIYKEHGFPISTNWTDPGFDVDGDTLVDAMINSSFKISELTHECDFVSRDTEHPFEATRDCGPHNFTSFLTENGEVCFTVNSGKDNHPMMNVDQPGLRYAYELKFDMRSEEAVITHPYNGIRIILHEQKESPLSKTGFVLKTGAKSFVMMHKVETRSLPPPFATECGEKKLKYHDVYNQKSCLLELLTDYIGEKCGCRQAYMPDKNLRYCSLREEITCVYPNKAKFDAFKMRENCPIDCIETSYNVQLTDQRYLHDPPLGFEKNMILTYLKENKNTNYSRLVELYDNMNITDFEKYIEDNVITVMFYYPELKETIYIQTGTFSFYKFLGDAGGEFGLMLGASLLTFFEFIDLIIFLIYHQVLRINSGRKKKEEDQMNGNVNGIELNNSSKDNKKDKKKKKNKKGEDEELSTLI